MEGREWDAEKNEDDFGKGGRHDKKGGFAGDQTDYTDGREYMYRESRGGSRGGRGRGRGALPEGRREQAAPTQDEFPALPPAPKTSLPDTTSKDVEPGADTPAKSWADQVESAAPS